MKKKSKIAVGILIFGGLLLLFFIGSLVLKEKYCYNFAFIELDKKGIKLGEVSQELREKGHSPLQVKSVSGSTEWNGFYLQCKREFNLFSFDFSVLGKVYPSYQHFIDW